MFIVADPMHFDIEVIQRSISVWGASHMKFASVFSSDFTGMYENVTFGPSQHCDSK